MWSFFTFCCWPLVFGFCFGVGWSLLFLLVCYNDIIGLSHFGYLCDYFIIDYCGILMSMLTIFLWLVLLLSGSSSFFLNLSVFSAIVCYFCVNSLVFWFFYELSIICALILLVIDSPYPERYVAGWYFGGYVVLGSLPLLLSIVVFGMLIGSSNIICWKEFGYSNLIISWLIGIVFMTKIPVPPFHVWLPLVHAEASSPTSIILSGYIMKLGVVGMLRFNSWIFNSDLLCSLVYFMCFFGLLFLLGSYVENDGKRWLAILSLFHILVAFVILAYGLAGYEVVSLLYCFGHGMAATSMFICIWWGYEFINSRSLSVLPVILGGGLVIQILSTFVFGNVGGFPPTSQFFSELVSVISLLGANDYLMLSIVGIYIFGGSLVVFIVYGSIITSIGGVGGVSRLGLESFWVVVVFISVISLMFIFII